MDLNVISSAGQQYTVPLQTLNENLVRKEITKNDYPHPTLLVGIALIVIVVLYICYISFVVLDISGTWYIDDNKIKVTHNKWNDTFTLSDTHPGYLVGNALYITVNGELHTGVVYKKKILWNNGEVWQKAIYAM